MTIFRSCLVLGAAKFVSPQPLHTCTPYASVYTEGLGAWVFGCTTKAAQAMYLTCQCIAIYTTIRCKLLVPFAHVLVSAVLLLSRSHLRRAITTAHASRATLAYSKQAWRSCTILQRPNTPQTPLLLSTTNNIVSNDGWTQIDPL